MVEKIRYYSDCFWGIVKGSARDSFAQLKYIFDMKFWLMTLFLFFQIFAAVLYRLHIGYVNQNLDIMGAMVISTFIVIMGRIVYRRLSYKSCYISIRGLFENIVKMLAKRVSRNKVYKVNRKLSFILKINEWTVLVGTWLIFVIIFLRKILYI